MPPKKEKKTKQKSVSLFDIEWAVIQKTYDFKSATESERLRKIIRDYIFLWKYIEHLRKENIEMLKDLSKRRNMFMLAEGFGAQHHEFDNPYDKTFEELLEAYPSIQTLEEGTAAYEEFLTRTGGQKPNE